MRKRIKEFFLFCFIVIKEFTDNELFYMANALTYRMIMAFFPFLIFILSLFRFINYDSQVFLALMEQLPAGFGEIVINFAKHAYLSNTIMSVSFLYGVWSATMGFHAIIKGMNRASSVRERRNFIVLWIFSFLLVLIFIVYIILSLTFVVFDESIIGLLNRFPLFQPLSKVIQELPLGILNIILTTVLVIIFYEFTAASRLKFREQLPGAVFTTLSWVLLSEAFGMYISINTNAFMIYGSIAGVFITIFWVNLLAMTLLGGAQLNSVIIQYRKLRKKNINMYRFYLNVIRGKIYERTKD